MVAVVGKADGRRWSRWRIAGWTAAAFILLVPLVAMQFTDQVNWSVGDFVVAAVLLLSVGIPLELAVKKTGDSTYRAAAGTALIAAFLLIWVNGAVGIIGSENNDANMMYFGVLAVGIIGSLIARFRPRGMSRALFATALATAVVAAIALILRLGAPENGPFEIVALNGFFVALFAGSAVLFRNAADRTSPRATT